MVALLKVLIYEDLYFYPYQSELLKLTGKEKEAIVKTGSNIIVSAGAGSGKTLTILGKVKYLIERKGYSEKEKVDKMRELVIRKCNKCYYIAQIK